MDELLLNALDLAGVKGAQYADIRLVNTTQERLVVRNGVVDTLSSDQSTGPIVNVYCSPHFNGLDTLGGCGPISYVRPPAGLPSIPTGFKYKEA